MPPSLDDMVSPAYPPKVMTKVLVFAYSKGIRSSRKIEELLESDVRYMWLAGGLRPDFHTIARFRKEKFDALSRMFADSVRLCKSLGLVNLNIAAFDGTKVAASASKKSLYDQQRLDNDLFASKCFLADSERDVLICPAGREMSFSIECQYGSGRYRVYSAHGCGTCSFRSQCAGVRSRKPPRFHKLQ
jgi:hypothetical protein